MAKSLIAQAGNQLDGFRDAVKKIREYRSQLERDREKPNILYVEWQKWLDKNASKGYRTGLTIFHDHKTPESIGPFVDLKWFMNEVKIQAEKSIQEHADKYNNGELPYPMEDCVSLWFRDEVEKFCKELIK